MALRHSVGLWFFVFVFVAFFFRAIPVAYESSQARGGIGAAVASLRHSHTRSQLHLRPRLQLVATLDP